MSLTSAICLHDFGVDVVTKKNGKKYAVQRKYYSDSQETTSDLLSSDYILPESDTRYYTESGLSGLCFVNKKSLKSEEKFPVFVS